LASKTKLIVNRTRGGALCVGKLADNPLLRMRGLLGRSGLPAGEGMLLTPAPSIHTAFMRFPIDALFLDRELRVIKIVERLGPWRVASKARARAVLELAAGESSRQGVKVGDLLELRERARTRKDGARTKERVREAGTPVVPVDGERSRMAPLRVLLISPDRHYRTAMSLLLARRNCSVRPATSARGLGKLLASDRCDIVVLDASAPSAGASLAAVETLAWPVGVVIIGEESAAPSNGGGGFNGRGGLAGRTALAKWGPFDELMDAIEAVDPGAQPEDHDEQP
jgi:uncharacterized membrane protein (UPF0127 family)